MAESGSDPFSDPRADALREAILAIDSARRSKTRKVMLGNKADSFLRKAFDKLTPDKKQKLFDDFYGGDDPGKKKLNPDMISITTGKKGRLYDLGEGKGSSGLDKALRQFEYAGAVLGKDKIGRQSIVIDKLPHRIVQDTGLPEWAIGKDGMLFKYGKPYLETNGRPVYVRVVGSLE